MKKWLIVALLAAGAVGVIRLMADRRRVEGASSETIWDKLRAKMEEMPEDFPPRVMFDNVAATNETTQRILELLEERDREVTPEAELLVVAHDGLRGNN